MAKAKKSSTCILQIRRCAAAGILTLSLALVPAVLATRSSQVRTFTVLYRFMGGADGRSPHAGLLRDTAGNLYGTTLLGGDLKCNAPYGCGTVFKLDVGGKETVLHRFSGGADGKLPSAGLIVDTAGNLYGTTSAGEFVGSYGTVFELDAAGKETVLHHFTGGADGGKPYAGVVRDSAGNLYGTTSGGGAYGNGTVFKLDATRIETVLHSFSGEPDGAIPMADLIRNSSGTLYGTTSSGGTYGNGTVFKLDSAGKETVLHSFAGGADSFPTGLIRDISGNLYGTARGDPTRCVLSHENCGTVFKVDPEGHETVLHEFHLGAGGFAPFAGLVRDGAGNLYGTTYWSEGAGGWGTVFKLDATGKETVLHTFTDSGDGANPSARLLRDSAGNLYGTTSGREGYGNGTVFKLIP